MHIKYCIGVFYSFKTSINKLVLFILMPIYHAQRILYQCQQITYTITSVWAQKTTDKNVQNICSNDVCCPLSVTYNAAIVQIGTATKDSWTDEKVLQSQLQYTIQQIHQLYQSTEICQFMNEKWIWLLKATQKLFWGFHT